MSICTGGPLRDSKQPSNNFGLSWRRGQIRISPFLSTVPGGGGEPPRGCPRRILSPYLLQIGDLQLYYLQQLTGCDGKVPCGPVRGYFGSLDIVLGIVSRNGFPADLPMPRRSAIRQDAAGRRKSAPLYASSRIAFSSIITL